MRKRRIVALLSVVGAGVLAGGTAWYRLSRVTPESDPERYWVQEGSRVYSRMPSVPLRDAEAIRRSMAAATVEDGEGVLQSNASLLESLRDTVVEFLTARLAASSSAEYISWMESRGYRFKTPADFEKRYGPLRFPADLVGLETADVPTLFAGMWAYEPARRAVPDALCTGPEAMTITLGRSNHNRFFTQDLGGLLGFDLWHGGAGATCRFWMAPPVSREDLVARHGQVVAAQVGVIACVPDSGRRPLIVNLFLDPGSSRWWIDGVSVTNYIGKHVGTPGWTCTEY